LAAAAATTTTTTTTRLRALINNYKHKNKQKFKVINYIH
jgi:hypothetical protein